MEKRIINFDGLVGFGGGGQPISKKSMESHKNWRDKYSEHENQIEQLKDEFWDWWHTQQQSWKYPPSIFDWILIKLNPSQTIGATPEKFLRESFGEICIEKSSKYISLLMEQGIPVLYPDSRQRPAIYKAMEEYAQSKSQPLEKRIKQLSSEVSADNVLLKDKNERIKELEGLKDEKIKEVIDLRIKLDLAHNKAIQQCIDDVTDQDLAVELIARFSGNSRGNPISRLAFTDAVLWMKSRLEKLKL